MLNLFCFIDRLIAYDSNDMPPVTNRQFIHTNSRSTTPNLYQNLK